MTSATFSSTSFNPGSLWKGQVRYSKFRTWEGKRSKLYLGRYNALPRKSLQISSCKKENEVRVALLGASGYTGAEIIRLLANHPFFRVALMTADRNAGKSIESVFPHFITQKDLPVLVSTSDADFSDVDAVFCCLPHGTTQDIIKGLPRSLKVVDLSADFRLRDISEYEQWYGQPHRAPDLQEEAVYGLTEIFREKIRNAHLIANPGCYPTSVQLPLVPLIKANLIELKNIIIDSKSGVSGAGRGAKVSNLYTELTEGIMSYGVTKHRHVPEIEQGLSDAAQTNVTVSFTPHLMPMSRGMQSTIYVEMASGISTEDLYQQLKVSYKDEEFVKLLDKGVVPRTHDVRGSNYCYVNVFPDRISGRAIIISVIDNLVKGASGQALQNLNIVMGFPESTGLGDPSTERTLYVNGLAEHTEAAKVMITAVINGAETHHQTNASIVAQTAQQLAGYGYYGQPPPMPSGPLNPSYSYSQTPTSNPYDQGYSQKPASYGQNVSVPVPTTTESQMEGGLFPTQVTPGYPPSVYSQPMANPQTYWTSSSFTGQQSAQTGYHQTNYSPMGCGGVQPAQAFASAAQQPYSQRGYPLHPTLPSPNCAQGACPRTYGQPQHEAQPHNGLAIDGNPNPVPPEAVPSQS